MSFTAYGTMQLGGTASPSAAVFSAETMKTYTICCRYSGGNFLVD